MKYKRLSILFSFIISTGLNAVDLPNTAVSPLKAQLHKNDAARITQLLQQPKEEASSNQAVTQNDNQSPEWTKADGMKVSALLVAFGVVIVWMTKDIKY